MRPLALISGFLIGLAAFAQVPVTQTQMQVQQGPPAEDPPAKDKGSDKPD